MFQVLVCHGEKHSLVCPPAVALTDKEAVLFLTRLAALDNAMLAVGPSREQWQKSFLDLLYTMCTKVVPPHVSAAQAHLDADPISFVSAPPLVSELKTFLRGSSCSKALCIAQLMDLPLIGESFEVQLSMKRNRACMRQSYSVPAACSAELHPPYFMFAP